MTNASHVLPEHLRADIQTLWDYHCINDDLQPADVGIGLGSHDLGVATHVANLWHEGLFRLIVFTGANAPSTVERFPRGEAVHYREQALKLGVPEDVILVEPTATNTAENLTKTAEVLAAAGSEWSSAIVASRPYQQRRVLATAGKVWPNKKVWCTSLPMSLDNYLAEIGDVEKVVNFLVGDTQRVIEYPRLGFAIAQPMPPVVHGAFERLIEAGYNERLLAV